MLKVQGLVFGFKRVGFRVSGLGFKFKGLVLGFWHSGCRVVVVWRRMYFLPLHFLGRHVPLILRHVPPAVLAHAPVLQPV